MAFQRVITHPRVSANQLKPAVAWRCISEWVEADQAWVSNPGSRHHDIRRRLLVDSDVRALAASMMCLIVWGWAETAMVDELLHTRYSTSRLRVHRGSFVGASMIAFWRDASNRIGLDGMVAVCLFGVRLESLTGVGMAFLAVSGAGVMLISAAGLYTYGDFLVLHWRVAASPR